MIVIMSIVIITYIDYKNDKIIMLQNMLPTSS